ncbi:MAG: ABC transporter substrate-binding protein [Myxococcales bacterium]|nr:ABC transporter substrate-binding protein [Myxococcales bacterium]
MTAWRASRDTTPSDVPPSSSSVQVPSCDFATCRQTNGGKASRCSAEGACIPLENEQCRAFADERTLADPETLWVGAMFPSRNADPFFADFGLASERAIELARRDFASVGGLPPAGGRARSIGVLACEDSTSPERAAEHLVRAGVPAVIGFRSSNDVIELSQAQFIPNDVLVVPSLNVSSLITSIPHPPDKPRMVYRTAITNGTAVSALAALLDSAAGPVAGLSRSKLKLLLVRTQTTVGTAFSEAVFDSVRVAELGPRFRELSFDDTKSEIDLSTLVGSALEHRPSVVVLQASDTVVRNFLLPVEKAWPASTPRPVYIVAGSVDGALATAIRNGDFHSTVLSMGAAIKTPANLKFTNSYNAAFNQKLVPEDAPAAPYDSFYLVAYAAYASGKTDPRGSDLARAIARLVPPGKPIDVGPTRILEAFTELDRGGTIDLQGALSRMDFDLKTGESPADYAILCPRRGADKKTLDLIDSGLVYDSAQKKLTGTFNCK